MTLFEMSKKEGSIVCFMSLINIDRTGMPNYLDLSIIRDYNYRSIYQFVLDLLYQVTEKETSERINT